MIIPLEKCDKSILNKVLEEKYKSQLCEKSNRWQAKQKHDKKIDDMMKKIFRGFHLDPQLHDIKVDKVNSQLIAIPRIKSLERMKG